METWRSMIWAPISQKVDGLLCQHASAQTYYSYANFRNLVRGRKARVHPYSQGIYRVDDGVDIIYGCRNGRIGRYLGGIFARCENLAQEYHLDRVPFSPNDVLVDCGANNGELGLWALRNGLRYFPIEPEELEAECCDLNNFAGQEKTCRSALWSSSGTLNFYSKPDSADSSLIAMNGFASTRTVKAITLEEFVVDKKLDRIRLLKLEAEGAEPEILEGASAVLNSIDYIAVDCGYERGVERRHTFIEVDRLLRKRGYEVVAAEFRRVTFLYKNTRI